MRLSYLDCEITETDPICAIFTKAVAWWFVPSLHITLVKNEGNTPMTSDISGTKP